ncbi:MAG: hypothetical protein DRN88_02885 [Candidatus Hydrothermarchaeota archaeon]|nr:MAG: hypothetical protein DRN88_02885 [Candidatus Hydrothermarchaeota archaeon]
MDKDKERYGSAKIEIDEVLGILKKEKKEEEKEKEKEKEIVIKKIDELISLIKEPPDEDPLYEAIVEISRKLDIVINKLDGVTSRLDSMIVGENPIVKDLEGDLRKVALEIEIMPTGEKIPLETLAERVGLDKEHTLEIVRELVSKGLNIEIVEEEKKIGIFSKKTIAIIKR